MLQWCDLFAKLFLERVRSTANRAGITASRAPRAPVDLGAAGAWTSGLGEMGQSSPQPPGTGESLDNEGIGNRMAPPDPAILPDFQHLAVPFSNQGKHHILWNVVHFHVERWRPCQVLLDSKGVTLLVGRHLKDGDAACTQ